MRITGISDSNSETLRRKTIQRLSVALRVKISTVGGAPILPNLKGVTISARLRRSGDEELILNGNLFAYARESMFFHAMESFQAASNGMTMGGDFWLYPGMIDLGSPINLQGDDELVFEVATVAGWCGAGIDAANTSIDFTWREAIGVEEAIPIIVCKPIQAAIGNLTESLGDNITSIGFINLAINQQLTDANAIFTKIDIRSDKYNVSDTLDHMIARRYTQFETSGVAHTRAMSFLYVPGAELDKVQVDLLMNAANVQNSDNYIVYRRFKEHYPTFMRAGAMKEKHDRRNENKLLKAMPQLAR